MNKRKKTLRQLVVALLLLCTIGLPIQNIVLANELSTTEEVITEETESATIAETDTGNSESMENESVPPSEKEAESTEITSSETLIEESKGLMDIPKFNSSEKQEASSATQPSEERPSTKAVTTGTFPNGSTSTWTFDDTTGTLTISGGTLVNPSMSIQNLTGISVSEITDIVCEDKLFLSGSCQSLFYASAATNLDVSNFDTSQVTDMSYMFYGSVAINLDLSNFDTSSVTDMSGMLGDTAANLDLGSFDTSQVNNMSYMFDSNAATSLDLSNFDTSQVQEMSYMFYGSAATSLDLSNFDTSQVYDMSYMFADSVATSLDLSNFDTSQVGGMDYMFSGSAATSLDLSSFDTSQVNSMSYMFAESAATNLDLSNFDTSQVQEMSYMFAESAATSLDLSNFDTSQVQEMNYMFADSVATNLDLSSFDTSQVQGMSYMFADSVVTSLDLSNFDTSQVHDMSYMFADSAIKNLDLNNFDTIHSPYMEYMFYGAQQLQKIILGSNFRFRSMDGVLPNPTPTNKYTGKWQNVGNGTVNNPKGSFVGTATELMFNQNTFAMADTYVWQPVLLEVVVKNLVLPVGGAWSSENNFLEATDSAGNSVDFNAITVTGSVDTTQPGVYTVDYSYGGITSTATITVLETMPASWINFFVDGTNVRSIPGSLLSKPEWDLMTGLWDKWNPGTVKVPTDKVPSEPTKQGYEFKGWEDTAGTIVDFSTLDLDLNSQNEFDFYAAFEKKEYTVTFDVEGKQEQQAVLFEELITEPTVPNKAGYAFTGWYDAKIGGTKWDFSTDTMPAKEVTLYARFNKLGFVTPEIKPSIPTIITPITPGVDPLTPSVKPPTIPGSGGNQTPSNDSGLNTVNTGNTMITSQEDIVTSSPAASQGGKLAKLGENNSLLLQGFGVLMVLSGVAFFLLKRRKMHS
ncbi:BspA family leucine-rich repeat surface protein [Listeria innocua]|uniref:BspA family leucine-rich repeat surface protein n=1 Tax=Listeria innocua TaxID=1642 RepID=UPI0016297E81|nr:BspA family leucine-rich repeat surface protein [Listeria innocua]MBC1385437.1 BspA family leucine-rich repeat surface protein [Listeria innocua]